MIFTNNTQDIIDAINDGHNIFITGSAGSGKTFLASKLISETDKVAALTATTGIAALNIGGETIHRFLSLGISCRPFEAGKIISKWERISRSNYISDVKKWKLMQSLEVLIIDEVSMLRSDQFELIDAVLSSIKGNSLPFGGVQIILVGDFFQLPPVVTNSDLRRYPDLKKPFVFQSDIWPDSGFKCFNLQTNYRQGEGQFLDALEEIRIGNVGKKEDELFRSRLNAKLNSDYNPVKIVPHKKTAHNENMKTLNNLSGNKILSEAEYTGGKYDVAALSKECPAEDKLYFCKGAQIMMLTNDKKGRWVNGTMGKITNIDNDHTPFVKLSNGLVVAVEPFKWEKVKHEVANDRVITKTIATMTQYPFKLAYCSTIHKSQGLTLDYIDLDLSKCFVHGQAYVALSRAKNIDGLVLRGWNPRVITADPDVLKFYNIK